MHTPLPCFGSCVHTNIPAAPDVRVVYVRPNARAFYARTPEGAPSPTTPLSAGIDLYACLDNDRLCVVPQGRVPVPTGISVQPLCPDMAGFVYSRSGLGAREGLTVAQGVGVIDPDYTGEIVVILLNTSREERALHKGDRIAQLVFQPIIRPLWREMPILEHTQRGGGGFGHTGR
ncbi:MAG: dUTP pyrophosphatase [Candidatus Desulfovibrio kirbyi]|uniref:dUTP diphosphatase n=1 Tax=Candidatus Desulfovibrio kirbyi TaxID=2696086 RepID=A0A6L2R7E2_9BACT|nr:MAG: dUTP pyrophosphatase [Candidatus Desulfovibrio kirbyi]